MSSLTPVATLHGVIAIASGGGGEPVLEDVTVKSGTTQQTVVAGEGYDGIGEVTVEPVALQDKIISSIGLGVQRYTADQGYDGMGQLTVTSSFREMHYPQNFQVDSGEIWLFTPNDFTPANYSKIRFKNSAGVDQQVYEAGGGGFDFVLYNSSIPEIPNYFFRDQTNMKSFKWLKRDAGQTIGNQAFDGCSNMTRFEMPYCSQVKDSAFYGCYKMMDYYFGYSDPGKSSIPTLPDSNNIVGATGFIIHVPANMEATYKAASGWSNLASHIVGDYEV